MNGFVGRIQSAKRVIQTVKSELRGGNMTNQYWYWWRPVGKSLPGDWQDILWFMLVFLTPTMLQWTAIASDLPVANRYLNAIGFIASFPLGWFGGFILWTVVFSAVSTLYVHITGEIF